MTIVIYDITAEPTEEIGRVENGEPSNDEVRSLLEPDGVPDDERALLTDYSGPSLVAVQEDPASPAEKAHGFQLPVEGDCVEFERGDERRRGDVCAVQRWPGRAPVVVVEVETEDGEREYEVTAEEVAIVHKAEDHDDKVAERIADRLLDDL